MASEDELARWAADPVLESRRRASEPALGASELRRWWHKGDWRILVAELFPDEQVEVAAIASERMPLSAPLVLTDRRLLSVRERVIRSPRILSIPRAQIRSMHVQDAHRYGTLHVATADRLLEFGLIENTTAWRFVGCWLAGLDGSLETTNSPLFAAVEDRPKPEDEPESVVTVTPEAYARIASKGGALYLWQRPFSRSLVVDKLSTVRPDGIEFSPLLEDSSTAVFVEADVPRPREVHVRLTGWPRQRLAVIWDGRRWGRRGIAADDGGAGPF